MPINKESLQLIDEEAVGPDFVVFQLCQQVNQHYYMLAGHCLYSQISYLYDLCQQLQCSR
jgi:hypothetical protein